LFIAKHRGQNFVNMFLHRPTKNGSCTLLFGCRSHQRCFFCSAVWSGFVRRSRAGSIALQVILAHRKQEKHQPKSLLWQDFAEVAKQVGVKEGLQCWEGNARLSERLG
jgi:adenine C2-methylase RlmN of 23S rRNA A2503 and tRNA A37